LAIVSGLTSNAPRVDTMAFLAILEWKFLKPILFGDTIRVVSRIEAIELQSRGRRGIVTWKRQIVNQKNDIVQEGTTQTIVRASRGSDRSATD
jgi:acyl dehydratase